MKQNELKALFLEKFGEDNTKIRSFFSPGRVNLIGEHTDYNGGCVFPAALTKGTTIIARPRTDGKIRMMATDLGEMVEGDIAHLGDYKNLRWGNYQFGVFNELKEQGYPLVGADLLYHDTTPHGGGLSSSAAIEISSAIAMSALGGKETIDLVEMAKISQLAEHHYVGVNCGIMDQFASAMGKENHAIFLNCKTLSYELVPVALDGYKLVISNTNKKRSLADSKYNERRSECENGFRILKNIFRDITCLGDVTPHMFRQSEEQFANEIVKKRVQHVVEENARVLLSVKVLKEKQLDHFGKLMIQSHNSLRNLYEVSCEELDILVEEALKVNGVLGSRMTGAGFGGCTVSLVKEDQIPTFIETVGVKYLERVGYEASFYISDLGNGGHEILE